MEIIMIELIKEDTPSICTFSDDSSNQNNKNVSTVSMHCPVFEIYKAPVVINPSSVAHSFYDVGEVRNHDERSPVMLGLDEETEVCRIQCNTSKGVQHRGRNCCCLVYHTACGMAR